MRIAVLAFAFGDIAVQQLASLPSLAVAAVAGAAGAGLLLLARRRRRAGFLAAVAAGGLLGFAWAAWRAAERLDDSLPASAEGREILVTGVIASLPQSFENGVRFEFAVEGSDAEVPQRLLLAWYRGWRSQEDDEFHSLPGVRPGERWQLRVRLRRPHGNVNPHGFDYEAWLLERDLRATGYVRRSQDNLRLEPLVAAPGYLIERARGFLRDRIAAVLGDAPYSGVMTALVIGDQRAIDADHWQVFSRTGTTHLMSISGLHVTMVAALFAWLGGRAWRLSRRLSLRLPAQQAAAAVGFVAALGYCLLSGFAVPAQRTLYMLAVVAAALWLRRSIAASRVLAAALLIVLLVDPWAVLSAGFWLSFGAVALLFFVGSGRLARDHWLAAWARTQWAVTIGMVPAMLALFQQFSLVSPLANAVAIPVISMVVTPLALVGALPPLDPALWLAERLMRPLMDLLVWLAASDWAVWQQAVPPVWALLAGLLGVGWLLLPRGVPARWLGVVLLLPAVFVAPPRPAAGEVMLRVLDVGQGLAVHVQTAGRDLLFDAGPAFSADANSGNRILVPYLRAIGVRALDTLVISHKDRDHEGGAASVLDALPTRQMISSLPAGHPLATVPLPQLPCQADMAWRWDGVDFRILHPAAADHGRARTSNELSCVLRIDSEHGSALIAADIEARSEQALLARPDAVVAADVLVVPHHGSNSSSTPAFVAAVRPGLAVMAAGYRNRFGHPAHGVVQRYRDAGAHVVRTDRDGAVTVNFTAAGIGVATLRQQEARYWRDR